METTDAGTSRVAGPLPVGTASATGDPVADALAARVAALDDATRAIASVLDVERVLQLIVDRVRDLVGARYAALGIVDEQGVIEQFITAGLTVEERARIGPLPRGRGLLGAIVQERRTIRLVDLAADPRSVGFPGGHPPMHSFLGVPIVVHGQSVGNLYLTEKIDASAGDGFTLADQELVEQFARHAGIAIDNARLHEQVSKLAVVDERERIGRDLHDGIIQSLYAVALSLEDVPELMDDSPADASARVDRAIESINLTIRSIRDFIFGLRPDLTASEDLRASLAALAEDFRLTTTIDVELELPDGRAPELSGEEHAELINIARESLSNVARHAGATQVVVALRQDADDLVLSVADNGRGFDPAAPRAAVHRGLVNISDRARSRGGSVSIESGPGAGTTIVVRLPGGVQ